MKNFKKLSLVAGFATLLSFSAEAQNNLFPTTGNAKINAYNVLDFGSIPSGSKTQQYIYGNESVQTLILGAGGVDMLNLSNGATLGKNMTLLNNAKFNAEYVYVGQKLSIGTIMNTNPNYSLTVNGGVACKSIKVELPNNDGTWPDYVFKKDYKLRSLEEVENYITTNNHLPDVPSELAVKTEGIDLGSMDAVLLRKVEELTLYMIQLQKDNLEMKAKLEAISK